MTTSSHEVTLKHLQSGYIYKFILTVSGNEEGDVLLKLGSSRRPKECVFISFNEKYGPDSSELQGFEFDKKCAENEDLRNGKNGTIPMMLVALWCMYRLFPKITNTDFQDKSVFSAGVSTVSLANYYFLKSGKTWYEYWFDAKPVIPAENRILQDARRKMSVIVSMPYDTFLRQSGMSDNRRLAAIFAEAHHRNSWFWLFQNFAADVQIRKDLQKCVTRIFRMFDTPSLAAFGWCMRKSIIMKMIESSIKIIKWEPSNKKLGSQSGGSLDDMIYMHGGHLIELNDDEE